MAIGFAIANSILLEAPEGLIVVDTTESAQAAREVLQEFRKVSNKPIKAIIYTHFHTDHTSGGGVGYNDNIFNTSVKCLSNVISSLPGDKHYY